jgi:hypothetical protein
MVALIAIIEDGVIKIYNVPSTNKANIILEPIEVLSMGDEIVLN